jgi:hypothetical protein
MGTTLRLISTMTFLHPLREIGWKLPGGFSPKAYMLACASKLYVLLDPDPCPRIMALDLAQASL